MEKWKQMEILEYALRQVNVNMLSARWFPFEQADRSSRPDFVL